MHNIKTTIHHICLIVADSLGLAEMAFSLLITLITFPSTTGTGWTNTTTNRTLNNRLEQRAAIWISQESHRSNQAQYLIESYRSNGACCIVSNSSNLTQVCSCSRKFPFVNNRLSPLISITSVHFFSFSFFDSFFTVNMKILEMQCTLYLQKKPGSPVVSQTSPHLIHFLHKEKRKPYKQEH